MADGILYKLSPAKKKTPAGALNILYRTVSMESYRTLYGTYSSRSRFQSVYYDVGISASPVCGCKGSSTTKTVSSRLLFA